VTEGRRREFSAFSQHHGEIPDPQALSTFESSKLKWEEKFSGLHKQLLDWHRTLLQLRRRIRSADGEASAVLSAKLEVEVDPKENWLVFRRGNLIAFFNFSDERQIVPGYADSNDVLASYPEDLKKSSEMPAHSVVIAERE
jgi:maltooligosyltrehalose trehalohydrolase